MQIFTNNPVKTSTVQVQQGYTESKKILSHIQTLYIKTMNTMLDVHEQQRLHRWHLRSDTWRYLPIVLPEINNNPNLPPLVRD